MHKINLYKEQKDILCEESNTILEATLGANLTHAHTCGGNGKCSTCRVTIIDGIENCTARTDTEQSMAEKLSLPDHVRLACQTRLTGDISIRRIVSDQFDLDLIFKQFSEDSKIILGSQQKLAILFTDIVDYTSFAERFPPYDIVHVLSRYYDLMNEVVIANNGLISDVIGDGILAVFGTDEKKGHEVSDAVKAVKGMKLKLDLFNEYLKENFNCQFSIRAGIHYGTAVIGPFDTGAMKKIAVIGDSVNYASRIESSNKEFNSHILLSKEAYQEVQGNYPDYKLHKTTLKGKSGEYELYEIELEGGQVQSLK